LFQQMRRSKPQRECAVVPEKMSAVEVFVLLGYGFGADSWRRRFERGLIPGLNEALPYGYNRAAVQGWLIEYSEDQEERLIARYFRRTIGRILGFDLIHAWRNRRRLVASDVVWTHTEREHLAALMLLRILCGVKRPRMIAQCVWLFDRWPRFSAPRRALYRYLLKQADIVTTQSPEDLRAAREIFPGVKSECILSGATVGAITAPRRTPVHKPLRLVAIGNDMHRDWETLIRAFGSMAGFEVKVASQKIPGRFLRGVDNVLVCSAKSEDEVRTLFRWADIVVVPLKPNLHVSGITVIFEAVVSGVPVVATDTGGLRAYFSDAEICYVPVADSTTMRRCVEQLAREDERRFKMMLKAQEQLWAAKLTRQGYADRHRELSEQLLNMGAVKSVTDSHGPGPPLKGAQLDTVKVFVHLGTGFGADSWSKRYKCGLIPGFNEPLPYGYYHAGGGGWSIEYSQDRRETSATEILRRGLTWLWGFDLIHAWRNRGGLLGADIVWAHTEREHLAVLLLFRLLGRSKRPKVIAQCVWVFDRWARLSRPKRALYRFLLKRADAITTQSNDNRMRARDLFPGTRSELLKFGIGSSVTGNSCKPIVHIPLHLIAVGNDMHRDWETLLHAFGGVSGVELRIISHKVPRRLVQAAPNVSAIPARTEAEVNCQYKWADIVVVPLKANLHVSGISVILEAILSGVAVVATDTGGLRAYFSDREICYVPIGDPAAMRTAVMDLARDHGRRADMTVRAQRRRMSAGLTAEAYAMRHRRLSEELLGIVREPSAQSETSSQMYR
jgi:glycosyltransferase involved in cell wall biosynthesis